MGKIRVAVIGVGVHGRRHADKLSRAPQADLVAVVDTDDAAAQGTAARHGVRGLAHYRDILAEVDAVSIAVPSRQHFEIARDCLLAGVDVLVEKPIAMDLGQADQLIALAARCRRVLQVGHVERYNPAVRVLVPRIDRPSYLSFTRVAKLSGRGTDIGVGLDLMIHDLDLACWMIDRPIVDVEAIGESVRSADFDVLQARLHFDGGCVVDLFASRVGTRPERKLTLMQPNGYARADLMSKTLDYVEGSKAAPAHDDSRAETHHGDALEAEIAAFLDRVVDRQLPLVDGAAGRQALKAALSIAEVASQARGRLTGAGLRLKLPIRA